MRRTKETNGGDVTSNYYDSNVAKTNTNYWCGARERCFISPKQPVWAQVTEAMNKGSHSVALKTFDKLFHDFFMTLHEIFMTFWNL